MTAPSVIPSLLAMRYVNALLAAAEKQGGFAPLRADITMFLSLIEGSADLRRILTSPVISARAGALALRAVMHTAGLGELLIGFCAQVVRNRRGAMMATFLEVALAEMDSREGIVRADVRVAAPFSESQSQQVQRSLSEQAGGADIDMHVTVDPSVMGGMLVRMGSVQMDSTVAGKLDRLKQSLRLSGAAA